MTKNDTDCLKYIENEMDPSERIVFEREIESNSDLLIEVESIRSIREKIKQDLPLISAPESILIAVQRISEQNSLKSKEYRIPPYITAAAAVLVCVITIGIFLIDESGQLQSDVNSASFNSEMTLPGENHDTERQTDNTTPWIDRNQVLHFTGSQEEIPGGVDSMIQNSYQNLTPVDNLNDLRRTQRNLHLTRTSN